MKWGSDDSQRDRVDPDVIVRQFHGESARRGSARPLRKRGQHRRDTLQSVLDQARQHLNNGPGRQIPALLIKVSTRPKRSRQEAAVRAARELSTPWYGAAGTRAFPPKVTPVTTSPNPLDFLDASTCAPRRR